MSGADSIYHQRDEYVQARRVLLDALEALQSHLDARSLFDGCGLHRLN